MKKWLQDNLTQRQRLSLKRLLVGTIDACVRVGAGVVRGGRRLLALAVKHGLDLDSAWNTGTPPAAPSAALPDQSWSAHDFLFMMNALSGAHGADAARRLSERTPLVSIIIPVFNKVEFTFQCLRSLVREINLDATEIIVVDNASTDETPRLLAHFAQFIRVVRNEENRGFVDACNQGAGLARGKFLVFLNNDTLVLPGWLQALLESIEPDESVGAVGSLFLYGDGTIQEAGSGVWRSGETFHYGWGASAADRRYNFAREVDYCSGASLLVRKEIFDRLGGFDRRYAPAYYEDVDLCFGVRSLGYRVLFQPASRLIHYEGVTAGRDTQTGFKRFQEINRDKFRDKWRETLEREHYERSDAHMEAAADRRSRLPNVIIFDERIPTPDRDAGSARMFFTLKALLKWCRPVFVALSRPDGVEYERLLWKEGIETANAVEYPGLMRRRNFYAAILSRPEVADALLPSLREAHRATLVVFDMVDTYFIRLEREHSLTGEARLAQEAARYRELETRLARGSDLVWCASSEDKRVMERVAPSVPIEVIPTIHPLHGRGKSFDERRDLLFIGNLFHRPNADAVHYLMREIFPLVRRELPDVKLAIVGDNVTPEIASYASEAVRVTGYVPEVAPLFEGSRVFVAPLRFGAGFKGKIGEALSYGMAVVTTTIGAEGIGLHDGVEALITDDPRQFAAAVVRAYQERELWQQLSDKGYRHVEQNYTPQVIEELINAPLKALGQRRRRIAPDAHDRKLTRG